MFCFVNRFVLVMVVLVVRECGVGAFMSLWSLLCIHYVGLANFVPALGIVAMFNGLTAISSGPLYGK